MKKNRGFEVVQDYMRKTNGEITLPTRGSERSAGYDFYTPCQITIPPHGCTGIIPMDVKAYMQDDEVLLLFVRSSIGVKKNVMLKNNTGIIDSDYYSNPSNDGNIGIALINNSNEEVIIPKGERVVQGIFVKYLVADNDSHGGSRQGGFGSSGK